MAGTARGCSRKGFSPRTDGGMPGDSTKSFLFASFSIGLWLAPAPAMAAEGTIPGPSSFFLLAFIALTTLVVVLLMAARHMRALHTAREAALERAARAEAAQALAEEENLAKSRFMAEMSHELRTPLNTVMGFSEMMAQEVLGPHLVPTYAGYARDIHASGRHLLSLADDLLDLARIESGHRILQETPVRLDHLGQDCLAMMQPEALRRDIRLARSTEAVQIWGDERALRQIMLNLLANAVKFTPSGGEVELQAGIDADARPYLAVADTGPGITTRELPLEGPHPRESRLDVSTGRGAGLGLAIVRGLTHLHGGALTLVSRTGGGTLARVNLPASRLTAMATTIEPAATICPDLPIPPRQAIA